MEKAYEIMQNADNCTFRKLKLLILNIYDLTLKIYDKTYRLFLTAIIKIKSD